MAIHPGHLWMSNHQSAVLQQNLQLTSSGEAIKVSRGGMKAGEDSKMVADQELSASLPLRYSQVSRLLVLITKHLIQHSQLTCTPHLTLAGGDITIKHSLRIHPLPAANLQPTPFLPLSRCRALALVCDDLDLDHPEPEAEPFADSGNVHHSYLSQTFTTLGDTDADTSTGTSTITTPSILEHLQALSLFQR